jgi:hypothetical protein
MADFGFIPNLTAGGDISPFRFVELSAAWTGAQANAASDNIIGVTDGSVRRFDSVYNAISGDAINFQPSNTVQVELGTGGCTAGNLLTSDANGKAVAGVNPQVCYYIALETGAAGEIVRAFRIGTRIVPA